jgi:hypothetical protein
MPNSDSVLPRRPFIFLGAIGYYTFDPDTSVLNISHTSLDERLILISSESDYGTVNALYNALNYGQVDLACDIVRDACKLAKYGPSSLDEEIPF